MVASKIIKAGGSEPDEFEKTVSQALLELELNSELKPQLRDLHITRARELEFATKKVSNLPIFVYSANNNNSLTVGCVCVNRNQCVDSDINLKIRNWFFMLRWNWIQMTHFSENTIAIEQNHFTIYHFTSFAIVEWI